MEMLSSEQRRFLDQATMAYREHLDLAAEWLAGRGIDLEHARRSGLGVVVDPPKAHEPASGRLSIPYITATGTVAITFRCMREHDCKAIGGHGKYWKAPGTKTRLYGSLWYDKAHDYIALTEGELDALTLQQIGIPALGVPGSENWKPYWTSVLQDFSTVYVFSDGDESGQKFAKRVLSEYDRAVNVRMPEGEDVNSCFVKYGEEFLKKKIGDE
jgi:hypothetical protein